VNSVLNCIKADQSINTDSAYTEKWPALYK